MVNIAAGYLGSSVDDDAAAPMPDRHIPEGLSPSWWYEAQAEQLSLCHELEDIADSLPASINRQKCIHAARTLGPLIKTVHHYEEKVLFPTMTEFRSTDTEFFSTIERLKFEHFADQCFAEELAERLLMLGAGDDDINMEATGYMLRGFFEGVRRHIAFEREHLTIMMVTVQS